MMRWGFAVLVLANVGLLMWATWYRGGVGEARAPNPVFHPEQMVPISAPGVALRLRKNERTEPSLVAAKPRPRCVSIGPFASAELADKAALRLTEAKQIATRRSEERKLESSYWVYLAPFTSRKQAEQRLREIERLGIRETLIMADADGNPAISLGLFTHAENAQKRLQELAQKGIQAKQEIRFRTENLAWFDLRLPEPADAVLERLRGVDWGVPGLEVRAEPCAPEPG
jgi:hypothetical protein